jgi:hypothetical protein
MTHWRVGKVRPNSEAVSPYGLGLVLGPTGSRKKKAPARGEPDTGASSPSPRRRGGSGLLADMWGWAEGYATGAMLVAYPMLVAGGPAAAATRLRYINDCLRGRGIY